MTSPEIVTSASALLMHLPGMRSQPKVAVVGVTGFIGSGLPALLACEGYQVTGISRRRQVPTPAIHAWQTFDNLDLRGHEAVINLSGESIDRRWTLENRQKFHASRIGTTREIIARIAELPAGQRPKLLVNASAVGIYGNRGDEWLDESAPRGSGYLADLCADWETTALEARDLGLRVVLPRIGIVLGRDGSAFRKLVTVFRAGIGGRLGSGKQWMPWIHVEDMRSAIVHAVMNESMDGPFNASAPHPETNRDFTRKLAKALHRPAILPVPGFALRLVFGEFGTALLAGQRTRAHALEQAGYRFHFPHLEEALSELTA
jgi:uncharacterized protein (TIGR01777 family)